MAALSLSFQSQGINGKRSSCSRMMVVSLTAGDLGSALVLLLFTFLVNFKSYGFGNILNSVVTITYLLLLVKD